MKQDPLNWLQDPELQQALAGLRKSCADRTLPVDIQREVHSLLSTQISSLGDIGTFDSRLRSSEATRRGSNFANAKAPLQWLITGPGRAWLLGGLMTGGAVLFVPTVSKMGGPEGVSVASRSSLETDVTSRRAPLVAPRFASPTGPESTIDSTPTPSASALADSAPADSAPADSAPADSALPNTAQATSTRTASTPLASDSTRRVASKRPGSSRPRGSDQGNLDLNYEIALLRLARASLIERPDFARELLKNYDRRFPKGSMRHEYEILLRRAEGGVPMPSQAPGPDLP